MQSDARSHGAATRIEVRPPRTRPSALCLALALVAGCASGPTYEQLSGSLPAIPPGQGRIFLFLTGATEVPGFFPQPTLDGAKIGELRTGTYLYADRPAGRHVVGIYVKEGNAAFGSQGATDPVDVLLAPGERVYIEADTLSLVGMVKVTLRPVPPDEGASTMLPLHPAPPASP